MKYFLTQPNNRLVYLPDFRLEVGEQLRYEGTAIGGARIVHEGRKLPDRCSFSKPNKAVITNDSCLVVNEHGKALSVRVTSTQTDLRHETVVGFVEGIEDYSSNAEAMELLRSALKTVS